MGARAEPFNLPDFAAPAAPVAAEPRPAAVSDHAIAQARLEGVTEGRRLAMETIAADEAASLARIADALESAKFAVAEARERDQAQVLAIAAQFLEEFAAGLAEARELDAALDLLRRLTAHSDDRRPARLVLARASRERLARKLDAALKARRIDDFVTLEADPSLSPGEMRLEWRGGEARRTRREITEATAAIVKSLRAPREQKS
jgi:flagellar biosynthesis/type III secretory pathway protein FliH